MRASVDDFLKQCLERGPCRFGQIQFTAAFQVTHRDDADEEDHRLAIFDDPHDAIEIARYDDSGTYRPLKTAPNLRRGWRLKLGGIRDLHLALDFLYPAALGIAFARNTASIAPVNLRTTLERQTGMYASTRKITDNQAAGVVACVCNHKTGCLKNILWQISGTCPVPVLPENRRPGDFDSPIVEIPLLCPEACNLLVAAARKVVKK